MPLPLTVTRVTHSCILIQIGDSVVLTDPWFSEKPAYHPGEPVAFGPGELPPLTAVLVSHSHYDHCDFGAFGAYPDHDVPVIAARTVTGPAVAAGFTRVTALAEWHDTAIGPLTVTAIPAKHGVYEIGFVIQGGGRAVYFAGDTMLIPELAEIPDRLGSLDLALLPVNGLRIGPLLPFLNRQVVMDAEEAASLTATLRPAAVVPHHYAFTSGPIGDVFITKGDRDPGHYRDAAARKAPGTEVRILAPGDPFTL